MPHSELPLETSCLAVKQRLDTGEDLVLIDCRERDEHAVVSIAGAHLLPMSEIGERREELSAFQGRPIVVHCHHGGRSLRVAQWLRQQGFAAQSMDGGIDQWAVEIDKSLPRY